MSKHWWDDGAYTNNGPHMIPEGAEDYNYPAGPPEERKPFLKRFRWWHYLLTCLFLFLGVCVWLWIVVSKGLPTLDQLENPKPELATRLVSADGELLDQYFIKNRTTVHLKDVPKDLIDALLATEDRDFYHHWGVNIWGNLRAAWTDVVTLSPRQGASTITQQLARNLYLSQEKSALRKLREVVSAVQIERTHTKNEILEMYLNVAYFGRGAYGIEAAAQVYFGRDVEKLTPAQSAYLVGILKGPENYDPDDDYEHAVARRNTVIDNMVDAKYINRVQAEKFKTEPLKVQAIQGYHGIAPHFAEMIRQDLAKRPELSGYDLYRDGLVVYTTLNAQMQRAANRAVTEHMTNYQKNFVDKRWNWAQHKPLLDSLLAKAIRADQDYRQAPNAIEKHKVNVELRGDKDFTDSVKEAEITLQCGFVCLDQQNGQILAMVGSSNYNEARYGLNHVTQIVRQPGSAFKPIIYAAAFEAGATPETVVSNQPISIPDGDHVWSPGNFEGEATGGSRSIRTALQYSINLCAIHAMLEITSTQDVIRMAKRLGIRSNIPAYPSIALGTAEVNPLELTSAYSTFANDGTRATPYAILRVEDHNGKILYRSKPELETVFDQRIAHMMTSALEDVVNSGTAVRIRSLGFHFPAAGKTGTTQSSADAWFIGYTPQYTAGVWVGFDDKRVNLGGADFQGGREAAPIWGLFMKYTYEALKPQITYFQTNYSAVPGNHPSSGGGAPKPDTSGVIQDKIPQVTQVPPTTPIPVVPPSQPAIPHSDLPSMQPPKPQPSNKPVSH